MKRMDDFSSLFHDKLQKAEMNVPADAWSELLSDLHAAESAERPAFFMGRTWWAAPVSSPDEQPILAEQVETLQNSSHSLPLVGMPDTHNASFEEPDKEEMVEMTITIQTQVFGTRQPGVSGGYTTASQEVESSVYEEQTQASESVLTDKKTRSWNLALTAGSTWPGKDHKAPLAVGFMLHKELSPSLALEAGLRYAHYPEKGGDDVQTLSLPVQLDITLAETKKTKVYAAVGGAVEKVLGHDFKEDPLQLSARGGIGVEYRLSDRLALFAEPAVTYRPNDGGQSNYLHTAHRVGVEMTGGLRMSF